MSQYCYACMRAFDASMDSCPFCGEPLRFETPVHRLRPGTVLDGRYLVGRTLGQGGFGVVQGGHGGHRVLQLVQPLGDGLHNGVGHFAGLVLSDQLLIYADR